LSGYFNPLTNYQVFAPLWSEDVVTTARATMVGTKEVSQTLSEGVRQTTPIINKEMVKPNPQTRL
jgi:hypothetical protein